MIEETQTTIRSVEELINEARKRGLEGGRMDGWNDRTDYENIIESINESTERMKRRLIERIMSKTKGEDSQNPTEIGFGWDDVIRKYYRGREIYNRYGKPNDGGAWKLEEAFKRYGESHSDLVEACLPVYWANTEKPEGEQK